jgi:phosphopentomutase
VAVCLFVQAASQHNLLYNGTIVYLQNVVRYIHTSFGHWEIRGSKLQCANIRRYRDLTNAWVTSLYCRVVTEISSCLKSLLRMFEARKQV